MKKIIIFSVIIIGLFVALAVASNTKTQQQVEGNPYGKDTLHQATIKQLTDPLYENRILPDELRELVASGETVTVYFHSPLCPACEQAGPIMIPIAESVGIDLKLFNLLEFEEGWDEYPLQSTPTILHFVDGQAVQGLEGLASEEEYEQWFLQLK